MPHAKLVEHSTHMSKEVGDAYVAMSSILAAPNIAAARLAAVALQGALDRISQRNSDMNKLAHSLSDEPVAEEKKGTASAPAASASDAKGKIGA